MYSGMVIEELVEMVARAEDYSHEFHGSAAEHEEPLSSRFLYEMADSQPMMIGVA